MKMARNRQDRQLRNDSAQQELQSLITLPEREEEIIPIKVVGVGGAGSNALDRIVLDGMDKGRPHRDQHRRAIARQLGRGAQSATWPRGHARSRRRRRSRAWLSGGGRIGRRNPAGAGRCADDFYLRRPRRRHLARALRRLSRSSRAKPARSSSSSPRSHFRSKENVAPPRRRRRCAGSTKSPTR